MFGEPVSRAPIESINPEANSITFESRKPSYRIRPIVSKSTFSSDQAAGINQPAMKNDTSTDWISRFMKQAPEGSSKRGLYSQGSRGNRGQIVKLLCEHRPYGRTSYSFYFFAASSWGAFTTFCLPFS